MPRHVSSARVEGLSKGIRKRLSEMALKISQEDPKYNSSTKYSFGLSYRI